MRHLGTFFICYYCLEKNKLYGPLLWMGFNCLKARATSRRQLTFNHQVPRNPWYSFYQRQKDEWLSRPWSHPVVLTTGALNWKSSVLTTRPLLHQASVLNTRPLLVLIFSYFLTHNHAAFNSFILSYFLKKSQNINQFLMQLQFSQEQKLPIFPKKSIFEGVLNIPLHYMELRNYFMVIIFHKCYLSVSHFCTCCVDLF